MKTITRPLPERAAPAPLPNRLSAIRIALIYAVAGFGWVVATEWLQHPNPDGGLARLAVGCLAGWWFVGATAATLGILLDRLFVRIRHTTRLLGECDTRWKLALQGSSQAIWEWNPETNETSHSPDWQVMLGYEADERVDDLSQWESRVHPEDLPWMREAMARHLAGESPEYASEHRVRCKDGSFRWILDRGKVADRNPDGTARILTGTIADIHRRKEEEVEFRRREAVLRLALEASATVTWEVDTELGRITYSNDLTAMAGAKEPSPYLALETFAEQIHPDDLARARAAIDRTLETGEPFDCEYRVRLPDGAFHWLAGRGRAVAEAGRRPTRVVGASQDITLRKQAEELLLAEATRRRILIEGSRDGIVVLNRDGKVVEANRRFAEMLGYTAAEVMELHVWDWDRSWPREKVLEAIRGLGPEGARFESRHYRKDGSFYDVELSNSSAEMRGEKLVFCVCHDMTERNRDKDALNESLLFMREAEKIARLGAWKVNPATDYLYWTEGVYEIVGAPLHYKPGLREGLSLYDAASIPLLLASLEAALRDGTPFTVEAGLTTMTGRHIWTEVRGFGRMEEDGQPYAVGTFQDITERRQREGYTRLHLRALQQLATDEPLPQVLDSVVNLLEFGKEDWAGSVMLVADDRTHLHFGAGPRLPRFYQESIRRVPIRVGAGSCGTAAASGQRIYVEELATHPYWVDFRDCAGRAGFRSCWSLPVRSAQGEVLGVIAVYRTTPGGPSGEDIRAIEEVMDLAGVAIRKMKSEEALREREERFRQLVETSCDWIWETDRDMRYTYASPKVTELLGYAPYEVLGRTRFDFMPDEEAARMRSVCDEIASQGRPFAAVEHTSMHRSGREVVLESSGSPLYGPDGGVAGYRGMDRDVSERKRMEMQLRQAQKMEAVGLLAGGIAHDFNNILAAMMINLGLVQMGEGLDPEIRKALEEIDGDARRAADLTRQLLMFSRRSVLAVRPLDLNDVIANLLKMLGRLIGEQIELHFQPRTGLPSVSADAGMLEQVVMNLVVNARDSMPNGGSVAITTTQVELTEADLPGGPDRRCGRFVCLSVSDTGKGIEPAALKRIFEPFFTTKAPGTGTGLGLATLHGIVAQHQGWVEVESAVGGGSTFRIFLPALAEPAVAETETAATAPAVAGSGEVVLVVEDDRNVREMIVLSLKHLGYRVHSAATGQQCLALWESLGGVVDLLLTDMVMPEGMTGLELAGRLRGMNPGLRVILSSGYSAEMVATGAPAASGCHYLPKPYTMRTLAEVVHQCLASPPAG